MTYQVVPTDAASIGLNTETVLIGDFHERVSQAAPLAPQSWDLSTAKHKAPKRVSIAPLTNRIFVTKADGESLPVIYPNSLCPWGQEMH